jgi:uncharacterized membrane protein
MKPSTFLGKLDHGKISLGIASAEKETTGEIRVFVSHRNVADARAAAEDQFLKLGMNKTKHRNGVLLFFAPSSQTFAIVGDQAIHEKCGHALWEKLVGEVRVHLKQNQFTEGILHGIQAVGTLLATHFPSDGTSGDELPNEVVED